MKKKPKKLQENLKKDKQTQSRTIGWLGEIYFKDSKFAQSILENIAFPNRFPPYFIIKAGQGQLVTRTDIGVTDKSITYYNYNPVFWDTPYLIYKVSFEHSEKKDFIYHTGEEILILLSGEIIYSFFWSTDDKKLERITKLVKVGDIIRINSAIPHHTWSNDIKGSEAWMIFTHISGSRINIAIDPEPNTNVNPHKTTEKELEDISRYFLIASGIAEKIRFYRERANLRIVELARNCGIDPSHLSRIENARINVSLDILLNIINYLHIELDPSEFFPVRCNEIISIPKHINKGKNNLPIQPLFDKSQNWSSSVHLMYCEISKGSIIEDWIESNKIENIKLGKYISWIMLSGQSIFEVNQSSLTNSTTTNHSQINGIVSDVLIAGSVVHFKNETKINFKALEDCQFLQVTYI